MSLFKRTLLSLMRLPGSTVLVLTDLKVDLRTYFTMGLSGLQTELRPDAL